MTGDHLSPKAAGVAQLAETKAIHRGILNVLRNWAETENALVELLTEILSHDNMRVPSAIYFSVTGIEGRMRLVDGALRALLQEREIEDKIHGRVIKSWERYLAAARRLRSVRNKVAHGQVVTIVNKAAPLGRPRLTSPVLDASEHSPPRKGAFPGLSGADLHNSAEAVSRLTHYTRAMTEFVRATSSGEPATLLEKLALLEAVRPNPEGSGNNQPLREP